jgi:(2R)-3-sulfolactate dehydrogenase (NADP+)
MSTERIAAGELERLMHAALHASGATQDMAAATARALAAAEVEGLASHGAWRVPQYCGHLRNGRATGSAVPRVSRDSRAACVVDAGGGLAFHALEVGVAEATRRAAEFGVAFVAIANSNHFGVAAHHAEPLARAGLVGLAMGNSPAAMPAWGGKRALFGTNPIAAAFPRRGADPLSIDLSLSAVARGRIMLAAKKGEPIPEGWAVDAQGRPTTDARAALEGSMLPAGGVKGAMLALVVELLVVALSGSAFGYESDSFFTEEGRPTRIGQALLAIDPRALAGEAVYLERVESLIAAMTEDPKVRLPGARRRGNAERSRREGLEVPAELLARIRALAA